MDSQNNTLLGLFGTPQDVSDFKRLAAERTGVCERLNRKIKNPEAVVFSISIEWNLQHAIREAQDHWGEDKANEYIKEIINLKD